MLDEDQGSLIENNLFAYCLNNSVNMADDEGTIAWWIAAAAGGALFDSATYLKDSIQLAKGTGKRMQLFIRPDTYLSGPLKQAIKQNNIKITYLW